MEPILVDEIVEITGGSLLDGSGRGEITNVCIDSRESKEGSLYVPICGKNVNGHTFIDQAFAKGAAAALTQERGHAQGHSLILVDDTINAMQKIAAYYRRKFDIPVIGVTGSAGKTSVKEMIYAVLSAKFCVMKTRGNFNGQIGLPLSIFDLNRSHESAVIEMGISEFGEMEKLALIASPNQAVIINIGVSHIENLKSKANIAKEKLHIIDHFSNSNAALFFNGDNDILKKAAEGIQVRKLDFGLNENNQLYAKNIQILNNSTKFTLVWEETQKQIEIPILGTHNVYNALAAIAVASSLGLSIDEIQRGLSSYKSIAMRQQIHRKGKLTIIDDSYNANPDSMKSALDVLTQVAQGSKRIAVLGDMLELGDHAEDEHYNLGKYASSKVDVIVTVGNLAKYIALGATDEKTSTIEYSFCRNQEVIDWLSQNINEPATVLVKGSRGMQMEEISRYLEG